jgi:hypothetical protein
VAVGERKGAEGDKGTEGVEEEKSKVAGEQGELRIVRINLATDDWLLPVKLEG